MTITSVELSLVEAPAPPRSFISLNELERLCRQRPTNYLIEKGGKIAAIAAGCDASGLLANKVSEKAAKVIGSDPVNVQKKVDENKGTPMKDKQ